MQISQHFSREATPTQRWMYIALAIGGLILVDQLTKIAAFASTPPARAMMDLPHWSMGLAWHIHEPNAHSHLQALLAFSLVTVAWLLPIPLFAKVNWVAAAASNHVEMLARPGTVDFLAVRLGETVWVANVADLYFVAGVLCVTVWMARRIRTAESWMQPVTA